MTHVVFVTPAHERLAVSALVFAQRARMLTQLRAVGVVASSVVVACDENLELAREHDFELVNVDNRYLGRRWNEGYVIAGELGATHAMPVGSDSIVDYRLVLAWLEHGAPWNAVTYTTAYSVFHSSGRRRVDCCVTRGGGGGMLINGALLRGCGWRPVGEKLARGCDHSTLRSLGAVAGRLTLTPVDVHPLAVVALQSNTQITSYDRLALRWGIEEERRDPYAALAYYHGAELADQVRALYAKPRRLARA